jgi:competence protein ComEC
VGVSLHGPLAVACAYAALAAAMGALLRWSARRSGLARAERPRGARVAVAAAVALMAVAIAWPSRAPSAPHAGLRVTVLDIGQGDAILLDPPAGAPVLVDGGPAGAGLGRALADEGVRRLAAVVVTHDQADHFGGVPEALGAVPVHALAYGQPAREVLAAARGAGVRAVQLAEGSELDSGALRLEVLWPPRELEAGAAAGGDPNATALVLLARWRSFRMLLTADAEAEAVPLDPGPVDVLKVAHHGSEDAGLGSLLDRAVPRLAVISVGADNSYGHPAAPTLATLAAHDVPVLRTDLDGDVTIDATRGGFTASPSP